MLTQLRTTMKPTALSQRHGINSFVAAWNYSNEGWDGF